MVETRLCSICGRIIPFDSNLCPYCGKDIRKLTEINTWADKENKPDITREKKNNKK